MSGFSGFEGSPSPFGDSGGATLCDIDTGRCVECLTSLDCDEDGFACVNGACVLGCDGQIANVCSP